MATRGFHPGFPQGQPGEASSRLLGRENLVRAAGAARAPSRCWSGPRPAAREGLQGTLAGLSGAPALDAQGRVIGRHHRRAPAPGPHLHHRAGEPERRPRPRLASPPPASPAGAPVTTENYGRVADDLRRDLRVAQVVCLA